MTTTIYQKFISRYAEIFTLVLITEGDESIQAEIIPSAKAAKLNKEEVEELYCELVESEEMASWSDGEEEFDEEDARAACHQEWDEINDSFDEIGL
jgi:hypothetical protein